ncbi:S41 family peptidase [Deefgea piscis]|uniref:S41 family peptidase n=1 Tax=Deefgea piscis TaxID=2739061 RepID=UPI001C7FB959|nr:S41 family peptidase [Deefgea piscis]QZA82224.1 hypothetical protein K4H25_06165 [Deefgea piscis]
MMRMNQGQKWALRCSAMGLTALLSACGGGGDGPGIFDGPSADLGNKPAVTPAPSTAVVAQKCSVNNPYRFDDTPLSTSGTLNDEKAWLKDNMSKNYLWYKDMPTVDAAAPAYSNESQVFGSLSAYFQALKTPLLTSSGAKVDKFSFIASTLAWNGYVDSGKVLEYGIQWHATGDKAPLVIRVAYVEPNSPADRAGIVRGDILKSVDGIAGDFSVAGLNALLYPSNSAAHQFTFDRAGNVKTATLAATDITISPVPMNKVIEVAGKKTGYLIFNSHISTAEQPLINAVQNFKDNNVSELILDLRYNGGGYLYIASELAYMIAGERATQNKVFEHLQYNDKRPVDTANGVIPFYNSTSKSQFLPTLNLKRVYILASGNTCSASESIINGLRGIDIDVQIIGNTTCGKPYGYIAKSNCGISYFPIEFKGVNDKGTGDFTDGFAPQCSANDDFTKPLGDTSEGLLAAAIYRQANPNLCKPAAAMAYSGTARIGQGASQGLVIKPEMQNNKYWTVR